MVSWINFSISGWVRHNGGRGVDLKMEVGAGGGGGNPFQNQFKCIPELAQDKKVIFSFKSKKWSWYLSKSLLNLLVSFALNYKHWKLENRKLPPPFVRQVWGQWKAHNFKGSQSFEQQVWWTFFVNKNEMQLKIHEMQVQVNPFHMFT